MSANGQRVALVSGASRGIGREIAMARTEAKRDLLVALGARSVVADALDPEAVASAVGEAGPEVIVHQLTAIPSSYNPRRLDRAFALTNRLRIEATDHLLSAARAVGARRFVAQSFAGWAFARGGGPVRTEDDELDGNPPRASRETIGAIRYLERAVTEATWIEGLALRCGVFYGPGTSLQLEPPGDQIEMIRRRRYAVVGHGTGVWSFIHTYDAAAATVAAVERGRQGVYNVVDDEPALVSDWLPALASAVGAKPPLRLPRWTAHLVAGKMATMMMTETRGASNAKAKRELSWQPRYPSWRRSGFTTRGIG